MIYLLIPVFAAIFIGYMCLSDAAENTGSDVGFSMLTLFFLLSLPVAVALAIFA